MSYAIEVTFRGIPDYRQIVSEELWKAAVRTQNAWRENLDAGIGATGSHGRPYVGTGEAIARTTVFPELPGADEYIVAGETVQHLIAEFGRTPGTKMPPPEPIERWAQEAGLVPREGETWESMIWTIRRHIAEHGLRGFAPGLLAMQTIAPTVEAAIKTRFERELEKK
ncbi:MAG: hypothetical protein GX932_03520 [Methanomicrobiales archaeon]|nr:hypothetical protein [Methanomicrobiales archaeon]